MERWGWGGGGVSASVKPVQRLNPRCYCLHQCIVPGLTDAPFTWHGVITTLLLQPLSFTHTHAHVRRAVPVLTSATQVSDHVSTLRFAQNSKNSAHIIKKTLMWAVSATQL